MAIVAGQIPELGTCGTSSRTPYQEATGDMHTEVRTYRAGSRGRTCVLAFGRPPEGFVGRERLEARHEEDWCRGPDTGTGTVPLRPVVRGRKEIRVTHR